MTQQLAYSSVVCDDPWDDLWTETHPKGTASWEDDIPDFDEMNDVEEQ